MRMPPSGLWPHLPHRLPQPQGAIVDHASRRRQTARREIAQDLRPALARLAVSTLDGEHHVRAVRERGDQHQQRGLRRLEPGLHVDPVGPHIHRFERGQVVGAPLRVVELPVLGQALHTARAQRRAIAQLPAQHQREVAAGEAVQLSFRQQLRHLWGASLKERQDAALEAGIEPPRARATKRDRPVHQRDLARLPVAIPIADGGLGRPAFMKAATQQVVDFFFEHALQAGLHFLTNTRLQHRPSWA